MNRLLSNSYLEQRKKRELEAIASGPRQINWSLTFSDLLTLLVTMFVLRFSMYSLPKKTLNDQLRSFPTRVVGKEVDQQAAETPDDFWLSVIPGKSEKISAMSDSLSRVLGAPERETEFGSGRRFGSTIVLTPSPGVLTASLLNSAFSADGDELTFEASEAIRTIGKTFGGPDFDIQIAATALLPKNQPSDFASDSELSTARALAVLRQFLDAGVDAQVLSVASYGSANRGIDHAERDSKLPLERVDISIRVKPEKALE